MPKEPNQLINASSPYLLQHAYNPVKWQEWGEEALTQAKAENKLILVSIGYAACHWCHVMEHESFENYEVAEVMNKHYVCIKIDREERPDIDQIYMLAVQLMGVNGGWPLNCICLPNQQPIYGGTYFRKNDWINILENIAHLWQQEPQKAKEYADKLSLGIQNAQKIFSNEIIESYTKTHLEEIVNPWKRNFDILNGGYNIAPKFPLPNNFTFLLRYAQLNKDEAVLQHTLQTLQKMAFGGIYDQIGGGFARYSVDDKWRVPHFEKMLYDNAQLIGLYAEAWQFSKHKLFKDIAIETINWVFREMTSPEGLFYSALDADSEGVEGKYYVWEKEEFDTILGEQASLMAKYYQVTEQGNWEEEETNILLKKQTDEDFAIEQGMSTDKLSKIVLETKNNLLKEREKRIKPALDDKCLTAWNALMIKALTESSIIFEEDLYYQKAKKTALFILNNLKTEDGTLYRNYKNNKATIVGFLDDYAFLIDALITLYQADFDGKWLQEAKILTDYVLQNFNDENSSMLFYTSQKAEKLIARKHEVTDNVIPAANSVMAQNLQTLGLLFDDEKFSNKALLMLASIQDKIKNYGSAYSNWAIQLQNNVFGINEIAFVGANQEQLKKELNQHYIPNKIMLGGENFTLPLLKNKESIETKIYICKNKTCNLPVTSATEALLLIHKY